MRFCIPVLGEFPSPERIEQHGLLDRLFAAGKQTLKGCMVGLWEEAVTVVWETRGGGGWEKGCVFVVATLKEEYHMRCGTKKFKYLTFLA